MQEITFARKIVYWFVLEPLFALIASVILYAMIWGAFSFLAWQPMSLNWDIFRTIYIISLLWGLWHSIEGYELW